MRHNSPYIIGLTGGIGSGKSVVSRLLRLLGVPVYDCDREAKRLMNEDVEIRTALVAMAGEDVYHVGGALNRAYLAAYMFGDEGRVQQVNRIVHPVVRADFKRWAHSSGKSVVAVESAILFEAGLEEDVDSVWLVHAPAEMRLQRAAKRDDVHEESVRKRMQHQLSENEYLQRADNVIRNDGAASLIEQVAQLLALCQES